MSFSVFAQWKSKVNTETNGQFLLNGNQKSIPRQMVRRIMAAMLPPPIAAACNVEMFTPFQLKQIFGYFLVIFRISTHSRSEGGEWLVDPLFGWLRCCCGGSGRRCCSRDWLRVEDYCERVFSALSNTICNQQTVTFFCLRLLMVKLCKSESERG